MGTVCVVYNANLTIIARNHLWRHTPQMVFVHHIYSGRTHQLAPLQDTGKEIGKQKSRNKYTHPKNACLL